MVVGGVFYAGAGYPAAYHGRYFFADYLRDWIKVLVADGADQVVAVLDFAEGADGPVCFAADPASGDLYYAATPAPPGALALSAARPNPGPGAVRLTLELPARARVELVVLDAAGRLVWRERARELPAGRSELGWSRETVRGGRAPAGICLARVTAGGMAAGRRFAWTP